jgi:hypothetical protein
MQQMLQQLLAMQEKAEADREVLKGIMDANTKSMREDIKSSQAEMRSIVDAWITDIKDSQKKTITCQDVTWEIQRRGRSSYPEDMLK